MDIEKLEKNLCKKGFDFARFQTGAEAADYIAASLSGKSVGIGGSMTVQQLGLYEKLRQSNRVIWHLVDGKTDEIMSAACNAEVYITSANAVSETGDILNIDGRGNRLAGTLMRKEKVYIIIGSNKVAPDFDAALERARNIAAPANCKRLEKKTPCAVSDHCFDCQSSERICNALLVFWHKPGWCDSMEVVLVDEELGF